MNCVRASVLKGKEFHMTMEEMRTIDVRTVDRATLVQRSSVKVDARKDKSERIKDYISQIGNPYCYLEGKTVVKISFADTDRTIEDCIHAYLSGI
jgi:hypothetical protein